MSSASIEMKRAPAPSGMIAIGGKYVDWFDSDVGFRAVPKPQPKAEVSANELAEKTLGMLAETGTAFHDRIAGRLPTGHRMHKAILAELLRNIPYLGTCRIGRVPLRQDGDRISVAEFYVTNFDAKISTQTRHFYNSPKQMLENSSMFFGVGIFADKYGRRLGFDERFGDAGVYFQTKNEVEALYLMASISSGKSIGQLKMLDRNNFNSAKP